MHDYTTVRLPAKPPAAKRALATITRGWDAASDSYDDGALDLRDIPADILKAAYRALGIDEDAS